MPTGEKINEVDRKMERCPRCGKQYEGTHFTLCYECLVLDALDEALQDLWNYETESIFRIKLEKIIKTEMEKIK